MIWALILSEWKSTKNILISMKKDLKSIARKEVYLNFQAVKLQNSLKL